MLSVGVSYSISDDTAMYCAEDLAGVASWVAAVHGQHTDIQFVHNIYYYDVLSQLGFVTSTYV